MIIDIFYYNSSLGRNCTVFYDDVKKVIVSGAAEDFTTGPPTPSVIYQDGDYSVVPRNTDPYGEVRYDVSSRVTASISKTDPTSYGAANGTITLTVSGGSGSFSYLWNDGNTGKDRSGLTAGTYSVTITDTQTGYSLSKSITLNNPTGSSLKVTPTITHVSASGATDGKIVLSVSGGTTPYTYEWWQNGVMIATTKDLLNLAEGYYSVEVRDSGSQSVWLNFMQVMIGAKDTTPEPYFYVPELNTLRYVHTDEQLDDRSTQPGHRLAEEEHYGVGSGCEYTQKVAQGDKVVTQIHTNYPELSAQLRSYPGGAIVSTYYPPVVLDNTPREIKIYSSVVPGVISGTSRLYPAGYDFPLQLAAGDTVRLEDSTINGTYVVQSREWDEAQDKPYVIINASTANALSATCVLFETVRTYNVHEFELPVNSLKGRYDVRIVARQSDGTEQEAVSEPFEVAANWPKTELIGYKHPINAFGMVYETGIHPQVRVEASLYKIAYGREAELHRSGQDLDILYAQHHKKYKLETWRIPGWMHWKLLQAFDHEEVTIRGMFYRTEEGYGEAGEQPRTFLSSATTILEQRKKKGAYSATQRNILYANGVPVLINANFVLP